jgi:hypothetical protein
LAVRNSTHSYGFALFAVNPGSQRGGELAPFENFALSRPRRD